MLTTVLFIMSMVCVIMFLINVLGVMRQIEINTPIPLLYKFGVEFSHTYISTPAIAYQVYFWFNYLGVI